MKPAIAWGALLSGLSVLIHPVSVRNMKPAIAWGALLTGGGWTRCSHSSCQCQEDWQEGLGWGGGQVIPKLRPPNTLAKANSALFQSLFSNLAGLSSRLWQCSAEPGVYDRWEKIRGIWLGRKIQMEKSQATLERKNTGKPLMKQFKPRRLVANKIVMVDIQLAKQCRKTFNTP